MLRGGLARKWVMSTFLLLEVMGCLGRMELGRPGLLLTLAGVCGRAVEVGKIKARTERVVFGWRWGKGSEREERG